MNIKIKATNLDLTPSIETYVEVKIGSLKKFIKKPESLGEIKVEVEIARTTMHHHKGNVFHAEANIYLPKKMIRAEYDGSDIRTAVDKVKDRLKAEITKYRETVQL